MTANLQTIGGDYIGMPLQIDSADHANKAYFSHCAQGKFSLQACDACALLRYPPTTACPWCGHGESKFKPVDTHGRVYTYAEVHHAIQPAFKPFLPYSILIVELETQRDQPGLNDALRVAGNLANQDGSLASVEDVKSIGIGSAVKMIFKKISDDVALPLWVLDHDREDAATIWRYPE